MFIQDAGGKLDVLVTNAGVLEQWRPFAETEPEEWWGTWEVNIRGSYLAARAATQSMLQRGQGGTIILISSAGSLRAKPGGSRMLYAAIPSCLHSTDSKIAYTRLQSNI